MLTAFITVFVVSRATHHLFCVLGLLWTHYKDIVTALNGVARQMCALLQGIVAYLGGEN